LTTRLQSTLKSFIIVIVKDKDCSLLSRGGSPTKSYQLIINGGIFMKKIVSLGLFVLLAGLNSPSQVKANDITQATTKVVAFPFKKAGNVILNTLKATKELGLGGLKSIKELGRSLGKGSKRLFLAGTELSKLTLFVVAIVATIYGLDYAIAWALKIGLPEWLGISGCNYDGLFVEKINALYNYLAPIISPCITTIPNVIKNIPKTVKSVPGLIKSIPSVLYVFMKH